MGFVSNSSSQCFILDLSQKGVPELVAKIKANGVKAPSDFGRYTTIAIGKEVRNYANDLCVEYGDDDEFTVAGWLLAWCKKLKKNTVFIRESDEGMGGYLFGDSTSWYEPSDDLKKLEELSLDNREYH